MSFADLMTEDRRLTVLRLLADAPGASCNAFVLHTGLVSMGHNCSRDRVETDAAWLAEQGLVTLERLDKVTVLTLTSQGDDVAHGRAGVPGVKRPVPGV